MTSAKREDFIMCHLEGPAKEEGRSANVQQEGEK